MTNITEVNPSTLHCAHAGALAATPITFPYPAADLSLGLAHGRAFVRKDLSRPSAHLLPSLLELSSTRARHRQHPVSLSPDDSRRKAREIADKSSGWVGK